MRSLPFLKLLAPLIIGILYSKHFLHLNWPICFSFLVISFVLCILFTNWTLLNLDGRSLSSIVIYFHVFLWAVFISKYREADNSIDFIEDGIHILKQRNNWKKNNKSYQVTLDFPQNKPSIRGGVVLKVYTNEKPHSLPGDILFFSSSIEEISPALNPYQFDYKSFARINGIAFTAYTRGALVIYKNTRFNLLREASKIRQKIIDRYDSMPLDQRSKSFVKALLLGDKSDLEKELKRSFSEAGVIHVLAVSGLHVGIIVLLFHKALFFLRFIKKRKPRLFIKTFLLLIIIWLFAGISGFSPSIIRAAIMFSFLTIGQLLSRHSNIYNSLALAAFLMLIINPNYLFMLGFQLSFLAVFAIVFFYPMIFKSLYIKAKFIRYFWGLISVSISAQLLTFPLTIFYFQQFPTYFILSNLVVIPAVFLILLLSILLLFLSFFKTFVILFSYTLNSLIYALSISITMLNSLPFHSYKVIVFNELELLFLFLLLLAIMLFLKSRKAIFVNFSLLFLCSFFGFRLYTKSIEYRNNELFIYALKNKTAINVIQNTHQYLFLDSNAFDQKAYVDKLSKANWIRNGIQYSTQEPEILFTEGLKVNTDYLMSKNHLLFKNTLLCLNHSSHGLSKTQGFPYRICLLTRSQLKNTFELEDYSSIVFNHANTNELSAPAMGYKKDEKRSKFHCLSQRGAFHLEIK